MIKIPGNNSYLVSFELFSVLCQRKWTGVIKTDNKMTGKNLD